MAKILKIRISCRCSSWISWPGPETQMTLAKVEIDPHGAHQMLTPLEECCGLNLLDHCFDFREDGWFGHQKRGHVFGIHRLGRSLGLNSMRCSGLKQAECLPSECVSSTQGFPKAELLFPCKEASRRQYKSKRICVGSVTVVSQRIVLRLEQVLRAALSLRPAACNGLDEVSQCLQSRQARVVFDTGSTNLWMASVLCKAEISEMSSWASLRSRLKHPQQ